MKRRIAAAVFAGALLVPVPLAATAAAATHSGSAELGCTSPSVPTCSGPMKALLDVLGLLSSGSAKGGKPA
ncbi:hypothetical protein [Nocardia sp. NPDC051832]|uniref:hypothetical protein n=1 Tax=Nocardia sp. NPDC051832 TaxID=3155673 RepID=UPI00343F1E68